MSVDAAQALLVWYDRNARALPWRSPPCGAPPPAYEVWLSEIMLQQTTVAAVIPRFKRFVARWPTIEALAAAGDEDILSEWAGLGYYARARNLIACARDVARRGAFPTTAAELRKLPGIGGYTAAAIAAIAFGEQAAAVDTNVERVMARLHGLERPRAEIEALVRNMLPPGRAGDFTQAVMDLGATICRPRAPLCMACPLRQHCAARASGSPETFPGARQKRVRPLKHGIAWWIERDSHVWLVRRPARGMLGGMAALPGGEWTEAALPAHPQRIGTVRHVFTHFSLELHLVRAAEPVGEGWWHPLAELEQAGLPTLYLRAARQVLDRKLSRAA
jgi:A/G-specific adenine glycosylase